MKEEKKQLSTLVTFGKLHQHRTKNSTGEKNKQKEKKTIQDPFLFDLLPLVITTTTKPHRMQFIGIIPLFVYLTTVLANLANFDDDRLSQVCSECIQNMIGAVQLNPILDYH